MREMHPSFWNSQRLIAGLLVGSASALGLWVPVGLAQAPSPPAPRCANLQPSAEVDGVQVTIPVTYCLGKRDRLQLLDKAGTPIAVWPDTRMLEIASKDIASRASSQAEIYRNRNIPISDGTSLCTNRWGTSEFTPDLAGICVGVSLASQDWYRLDQYLNWSLSRPAPAKGSKAGSSYAYHAYLKGILILTKQSLNSASEDEFRKWHLISASHGFSDAAFFIKLNDN